MKEELDAFCAANPNDYDVTKNFILTWLDGVSSPYYEIVYNLVEIFINGNADKKRRTLIFHGVTDSGKSKIASYVAKIFTSFSYDIGKTIFDQAVSREDAHV